MKYILVPMQVFDAGDRVLTSEGPATVIHDEMEGFDEQYATALSSMPIGKYTAERMLENMKMRAGVIMRLDKPTSKHPNVNEDYVEGRESLTIYRG